MAPPDQQIKLKRGVNLLGGVALIVGTMIGSGIFISPGGLLRSTGSVALSFIVWISCGIISLFGALCYAELGTLIGQSGGEYIYLYVGLGDVSAYFFSWVQNIVMKPSSIAILALTFAQYTCQALFDNCGPPIFVQKLTAAACILTVSILNAVSVRASMLVQTWMTAAKLGATALIIVGGVVMLAQGKLQNLSTGFEGSVTSPGKIAIAFYNGLWAYDGWNNLNYCTEELKDPLKNLPRSIIIAIPLVTILYAFINVSYLTVMTTSEILNSPAVATVWAQRVLGPAAPFIPIAVALSTFSALNGVMFSTGRLCFAAARKGHFMQIFGMVHCRKITPVPSIMFTAILSILMIVPSNIEQLIDIFSFTAWLFYALTFLSLIIMRKTKAGAPRAYKVSLPIAIICFVLSLYLVAAPIIDEPKIEFLYATAFGASGILLYIPLVYFKLKVPCIDRITIFLQLFLNVTKPSDYEE